MTREEVKNINAMQSSCNCTMASTTKAIRNKKWIYELYQSWVTKCLTQKHYLQVMNSVCQLQLWRSAWVRRTRATAIAISPDRTRLHGFTWQESIHNSSNIMRLDENAVVVGSLPNRSVRLAQVIQRFWFGINAIAIEIESKTHQFIIILGKIKEKSKQRYSVRVNELK